MTCHGIRRRVMQRAMKFLLKTFNTWWHVMTYFMTCQHVLWKPAARHENMSRKLGTGTHSYFQPCLERYISRLRGSNSSHIRGSALTDKLSGYVVYLTVAFLKVSTHRRTSHVLFWYAEIGPEFQMGAKFSPTDFLGFCFLPSWTWL